MNLTPRRPSGYAPSLTTNSFPMDISTPDQSQTLLPLTSEATRNATSSPASADGPLPCPWLVGQRIGPSGLVPAPASPLATQVKERARLILAISGPHGSGSSASVSLVRSLGSRLLARLPSPGTMEYRLTWKARFTPQGRLICALRASGRRTSDSASIGLPETPQSALVQGGASPNGIPESRGGMQSNPEKAMELRSRGHMLNLDDQATFTVPLATYNTPRATVGANGGPNQAGGALPHDAAMMVPLAAWPSPTVGNAMGSQMAKDASATGRRLDGSKATVSLPQVASLSAWPSPMAGTPATETNNEAGNNDSSRKTVALVTPWSTPSSPDWKDTPGMATTGTNPDGSERIRLDQLPRQAALTSGPTSNSSTAGTRKSAVLNPDLSRWLMGYPAAWLSCGVSAMQSIPRSRRNSSAPISKQLPDQPT